MKVQLVSPTCAAMPLIVMPARVTHLGPQLSRLPDELIHHIFKFLATGMFPATSRFHKLIEPRIFDILNHHYAINRIRNVSPAFKVFFMEAFYENFPFAFKHPEMFNLQSHYLTSFPAPVPALHFRHHLRSIRLDLVLETYYFTPPILLEFARMRFIGRSGRKIVSTAQMLAFCPSARFLLLLTNEEYGFPHLKSLHLRIRVDEQLHAISDEFLAVLDKMDFVVRAGTVEVEVSDKDGSVREAHKEVQRRIRVAS